MLGARGMNCPLPAGSCPFPASLGQDVPARMGKVPPAEPGESQREVRAKSEGQCGESSATAPGRDSRCPLANSRLPGAHSALPSAGGSARTAFLAKHKHGAPQAVPCRWHPTFRPPGAAGSFLSHHSRALPQRGGTGQLRRLPENPSGGRCCAHGEPRIPASR